MYTKQSDSATGRFCYPCKMTTGNENRETERPRIVFVIEGGRSRADVAALQAVATAAEAAGATVSVVRHGLGRLSARTARLAIGKQKPDVVVTSGASSTRDVEKLTTARGIALVCDYWPAGPIEDIHRRPRHKSQTKKRLPRVAIPTHALVGSRLHEAALRRYLGTSFEKLEVHVLPPLLDETVLAGSAEPSESARRIGVYGGHGQELPTAAPYQYIDLDIAPGSTTSWLAETRAELARLRECDAVLLLSCGTADEREAPRRCATALLSHKPVLACGFGDDGESLPLSLSDGRSEMGGMLRTVNKSQLATAVAQLATDLSSLTRAASAEVVKVLTPQKVIDEHVRLLLQIARERRTRQGTKKPTAAQRLLTRLRTLLRRKKPS